MSWAVAAVVWAIAFGWLGILGLLIRRRRLELRRLEELLRRVYQLRGGHE